MQKLCTATKWKKYRYSIGRHVSQPRFRLFASYNGEVNRKKGGRLDEWTAGREEWVTR